ncbi:MAG: M20/M25/M40 family metallo-hydrolase [Clostridia bacterium]|nr:M20/M25/M40 family metallo-hydrolase [Clostridia bacterium]
MDLSKIIEKKSGYAKYIYQEIRYICTKLEKREPGSKGEEQACVYMGDVMKRLGCDRVEVESFKENPRSFFGWIFITISCVLLAILFFLLGVGIGGTLSKIFPIISIILIIFGLLLALLQFGLYKKAVDFLFKEKEGHNVTAYKKPTGEVKRRIVFNGHPDAAWEWPVNYALGGVGFESHAILCAVGAVFYCVISLIAFIKAIGGQDLSTIFHVGLWGLFFTPFLIGLYFMVNYRRIVDGANDNLTGCYMGIAILKALKDEDIQLENTEICVCLTGSEEAGLRGSKAWCEAHPHDFDDVPTFIYSYDTIHDPKYLLVNYRDLNGTVKADKDVSDLFLESAQELGIVCNKGMVPPLGGATDNAAFSQAGMRSTGITGLNHKLESYYHTRKDSYDNLNLEGIADCFAVSVKVLEKFDAGAKQ